MKEIWRDIPEYEGLYQVSNLGRVKSVAKEVRLINRWGQDATRKTEEKILKTRLNRNGYVKVILSKNGKRKTFTVHRLVAQAFIPNPENKPAIDHINAIKTENVVENLRWVTPKENCENPLWVNREISDETKRKMSEKGRHSHNKPILQLDAEGNLIKEWVSTAVAAGQLGLSKSAICQCLKGRNKMSYGFKWVYKEKGGA